MRPHSGSAIGYITVESEELLGLCLKSFHASSNSLDLVLNGTLPREDLRRIQAALTIKDPQGLVGRFDSKKLIYIDSWSELFAMGCIAEYFNHKAKGCHWKVGIGIEKKYKVSELRERYLGDGALCCDELDARAIFQECKAQNLRGEKSNAEIQIEIIERINAKLEKHRADPPKSRSLLVTVFGREGAENKIDFKDVYDQTIGKDNEASTVFDTVFCIITENNLNNARIFRLDVPTTSAQEFLSHAFNLTFKEVGKLNKAG